MAQGQIESASKSKSGKVVNVKIGGQFYITKNWEFQNMVGQTITFEPSPGKGDTVWINEYGVMGQSGTASSQVFDQAHQQYTEANPPPIAGGPVYTPTNQTHQPTDKDLTITALALVKCIEGIKTPQQAYEHFNEVKRLLSGKANPQTPEGYMEGHDQEIPF